MTNRHITITGKPTDPTYCGWRPVYRTFDGPNDPRRCNFCGGTGLYDAGHLECDDCNGRGSKEDN